MGSNVKERPVHFLPPSASFLFFLSLFFTFFMLSRFPPFFQEISLSQPLYYASPLFSVLGRGKTTENELRDCVSTKEEGLARLIYPHLQIGKLKLNTHPLLNSFNFVFLNHYKQYFCFAVACMLVFMKWF